MITAALLALEIAAALYVGVVNLGIALGSRRRGYRRYFVPGGYTPAGL